MADRTGTALSDLHDHILPGIDDGARDVEMSRALLDKEAQDGVRQILFTPHFYAQRMKLDEFLKNREAAYRKILPLCEEREISTALGAEVRMYPELLSMSMDEIRSLRMGQTQYFLLEWPFQGGYPLWGDDVVQHVRQAGLRPVFAHIERYEFLFLEEDRLRRYLEQGCLFQTNSETVLDKNIQKREIELIREGLIHIVCTDAHHPVRRPVRLKEAMEVIRKRAGREAQERLVRNADDIFHDRTVHVHDKKRRGLFGRR